MKTHPTEGNLDHIKAMMMMTDELGPLEYDLSTEITLDERIPEFKTVYSCPWDNTNGDVTYFR